MAAVGAPISPPRRSSPPFLHTQPSYAVYSLRCSTRAGSVVRRCEVDTSGALVGTSKPSRRQACRGFTGEQGVHLAAADKKCKKRKMYRPLSGFELFMRYAHSGTDDRDSPTDIKGRQPATYSCLAPPRAWTHETTVAHRLSRVTHEGQTQARVTPCSPLAPSPAGWWRGLRGGCSAVGARPLRPLGWPRPGRGRGGVACAAAAA